MAIVSGLLWILLLIDTGLLGLTSSAILIGFVVGLNRVIRWQDVFKQFPATLGCYVIVVFLYVLIGTTLGILREFDAIAMAYIAVYIIPILLVGEWIGWVLRPSNHLLVRPAREFRSTADAECAELTAEDL